MFTTSSCDQNLFPSDELNGSALMNDEGGAAYIIDGCYAMLKEEYAYIEYESSNTYIRHYLMDAEFPADNICLSGRTTDPLYQATCYKMTDNLKNVGLPWWIGYKVIYTCNNVIEGFEEGKSAECDQLLGEAYFLRAMVHFHFVTLFAKPYILGRDNMGVPLRTSTNTEVTTRATVGEVYDQVVKDLRKAATLMNKPRGNAGYASKNTALGLLSRVYLYEEKNDSVIAVVDEMGGNPASYLETADFPNYYAKALSSKETLLAIAHTSLENRGSGSIGSMYTNDGGGWGEIYASDPLLNLLERYPEDLRMSFIDFQEETSTSIVYTGKDCVFFPVKSEDATADFRSNLYAEVKTDATGKYCTIDGTDYRIKEVKVNGMNQPDAAGEYTLYFVNYGGEDCAARIMKFPVHRFTFPNYFVTKYSYQDGQPMLSSPVLLRWGEVVLNRAEAYAKLGRVNDALDDVNAIRTRAGLSGTALFSAGNMHGYTDVLDVVLDERRMELCFEGHRMFDVYRNRRDMDRRYPGVQPWEVIKYTDDKIQFPIPYGEISVSGIPQNPGY